MYDKKTSILDTPNSIQYVFNKYNIPFENVMLSGLLGDIVELSNKFIFDINNGITPADVAMLLSKQGFNLSDPTVLYEFTNAITQAVAELAGSIVLHDLTGTVKYVVNANGYQFALESYRI